MRWNASTLGKTVRTNTVGGSGLWSLPAQARARRTDNWAIATSSFDSDALAYIRAVESADGEALETGVVTAINNFVSGLKTDNVWADIEAACILAGARTLAGALTPLKGSAPTNYNFVSSDYQRFNGLRGDGSTKYLDSNRANDAAGTQDDFHMGFYASITRQGNVNTPIGCGLTGTTGSTIIRNGSSNSIAMSNSRCRNTTGDNWNIQEPFSRFFGMSRDNGSTWNGTSDETSPTYTRASQAPAAGNVYVFATNNGGTATEYDGRARIMFYTIGTATTLTSIRDRVFTLVDELRNFQS